MYVLSDISHPVTEDSVKIDGNRMHKPSKLVCLCSDNFFDTVGE